MKKSFIAAALVVAGSVSAEIDPIVIVGDRNEQPVSQAAQSIQVITRQQIEDFGISSVGEALAQLASVSLQDSQGNGNNTQVAIRGFSNDAAQNVTILIDGVVVDFVTKEGGRIDLVNMDRVERIEVMNGSGGVLYGNGATAGVVNIVTKQSTGNQDSIAATAGSFGLGALSLNGSRTNEEGGVFSYSLGTLSRDGYRNFTETKHDKINLSYRVREGATLFETRINGSKEKRYTQGATQLSTLQNDRRSGGALDVYDYDRLGFAQTIAVDSNAGETRLVLSHQTSDQFTKAQTYTSTNDTERDDIRLTHSFDTTRTHTVLGLEKSRNVYEYYGQKRAETQAAFARSSLYWNNTRLIAGLRSEQTDMQKNGSRTFSNTAYELGLVNSISDQWTLKLRADTQFRTPSLDEYEATPLTDQTGHSYEIGGIYARDHWFVDLSAFIVQLENEISYTFGSFGFWDAINIDRSERKGFQVKTEFQASDDWSYNASLNLLDATFSDGDVAGNKIPMAPEVTLALGSTRSFGDKIRVSASARYESEKALYDDYGNVNAPLDEFVEIDVFANYELNASTQVGLKVKNVLNHDRFAYGVAGANGAPAYVPNEGRDIRVTVNHRF